MCGERLYSQRIKRIKRIFLFASSALSLLRGAWNERKTEMIIKYTVPIILMLLLTPLTSEAQPDSLWAVALGRQQSDCQAATRTIDGGFALCGFTNDDGIWLFLVKADSSGEELWTAKFGESWFHTWGMGITELQNGTLVAVGTTDAYGNGRDDGFAINLSQAGDSLWFRIYGTDGSDFLKDVIPTNDGGFIAAGWQAGNGWAVKADADGNVEWEGSYGGDGSQRFDAVVELDDGSFVFGGQTPSLEDGSRDYYLVKVDSIGQEIWSQSYGNPRHDSCYDMVNTSDGGFALGGYCTYLDSDGDFYLVRTDSSGDMLWQQHYGGLRNDIMYGLTSLEDGGFALVGETASFRYHNDNYYIVRTDRDGEVEWWSEFGGRGIDRCQEAMVTPDGGFGLAGMSRTFGMAGAFWLVRLGPDPVGVPRLIDPAFPSDLILQTPYPNPFNSTTRIAFQLPYPSHVNLSIHDQQGREVTVLLNQNLTSGSHEVRWQAKDQPSGMYHCIMDADGFKISKGVAFVR